MGRGEIGNVPCTQGMPPATPCSCFSPTWVPMHLSVVSRVITLACVNYDTAHRCETLKVDLAIWSFCPRKREGNLSPSLALLPLIHFNAS